MNTDTGIEPCPVCGCPPAVHHDQSPGGVFVKIFCEPSFSVMHLEIERGGASEEWALAKAIQAWNMKAARVKEALTDPVDEMKCWNPEKRRFE